MLTSIIRKTPQGSPTAWSVALTYGAPRPDGGHGAPRGAPSGMVQLTPTAQGSGELLAPFSGKVNVHPPTGALRGTLKDDVIAALDGVSLTLYLVPTLNKLSNDAYARIVPSIAGRFLDADALGAEGDRVVNFVECLVLQGLDGASVRAALMPRAVTIRNNARALRTADADWKNFLLGRKPLAINAGALLGRVLAGRICGVGLLTPVGLIDPRLLFERAVAEGVVSADDLPGVQALLSLLPASPPAIAPGMAAGTIGADRIYRWPDLMAWRAAARPTWAEWRGIADRQKSQFRAQLAERARPQGTAPRFVFNEEDARNPLQLEAIAEFYLNFPEPGNTQASPPSPTPLNYNSLDFTDLFGRDAQAQGTTVTLDAAPSPNRIVCGRDVLELDAESVRAKKQFRIMGVALTVHPNRIRVVVDKPPTLAFNSSWRILQDPTLVLVDEGGARVSGDVARRTAQDTLTLEGLNETQALGVERCNAHFDTIGLLDAPDGTRCDFRIRNVTVRRRRRRPTQAVLKLDADPALQGDPSRWAIPAGLGGRQAPVPWPRPAQVSNPKQYDQYDGRLFVVSGECVPVVLPWSSYTSRRQPAEMYLSSLDGNRHYRATSALTQKHKATFKVIEGEGLPRGNQALAADDQAGTGIDLDIESLRPIDYHRDNGWKLYLLSAETPRTKALSLRVRNHEQDLALRRVHVSSKNRAARPATPTPYWIELYDGTRRAAFYFKERVTADDALSEPPRGKNTVGKAFIRLHRGNIVGSGSRGCLVSPWYASFRNVMTSLHLRRNRTFYVEHPKADRIADINFTTPDGFPEETPPVVRTYLNAAGKLDNLITRLKQQAGRVVEAARAAASLGGDELAGIIESLSQIASALEARTQANAKHGDGVDPSSLEELFDDLEELLNSAPTVAMERLQSTELVQRLAALATLNKEIALARVNRDREENRVGWTHALQSDFYLIRPHERLVG